MSSVDFLPIAKRVIGVHEGGYNDIEQDKGGATNYGVSLRFLMGLDMADADINDDGHVSKSDIRALDMETALSLYKKYFWDHYNIDQFGHPELKEKMFSLVINMRGKTAMKCMQRAIRAMGVDCVDDGVFGPASRKALQQVYATTNHRVMLPAVKSEAAGVYRTIAHANPDQRIFLKGWLNRAYD